MAVTVAGKSSKELLEARATLVKQAQAHHAENEDNWTSECEAKHAEMMADAQAYADALRRRKQLESLDLSAGPKGSGSSERGGDGDVGSRVAGAMGDDPGDVPGGQRGAPSRRIQIRDGRTADGRPRYREVEVSRRGQEDYRSAFAGYLASGRPRAGLDETQAVESNGISQYATLQSDSATRGGYLVAEEEFAAELLKEVDDLLFIRQRAKVHTLPTASSLGIRKRTARLSSFAWSSELTVSDNDTALKYGKKVLTPHHLTGSVKISRDLARRESMIVSEVRGELARDGGEAMEDGYLLGTGDRQPLGVFVASNDGISTSRDSQTGSSTGITADGLITAKYALKSQYRRGQRGEISWLFHRDAIGKIALLKDSDNQYLFRVGAGFAADNGAPEDMLLGFPVDESERCPNTFTTGLYVGMLANWRYYEIADALDMEIQVLVELNARTNEYEYIARLKTDGMPTLEEAFVRLKTN